MVINKDLRVAGTQYTTNDLCPKILYEDRFGTADDVHLADSLNNYDYIDITWFIQDPGNQYFHCDQRITTRCYVEVDMCISGVVGHPGWNQMAYASTGLHADNFYLRKNGSMPCTVISIGYYDTNPTWYNKDHTPVCYIRKVVGYQIRQNYNEIDRTYHQ